MDSNHSKFSQNTTVYSSINPTTSFGLIGHHQVDQQYNITYTVTRKPTLRILNIYIIMLNMYNMIYVTRTLQCDKTIQRRTAKCTSVQFKLPFHDIFYMHMFRTPRLIFRKEVVTNTVTV